ncbi:hypothetical protein QBC37DRAFT_381173 [Rhypophila decipiens]|uniref:Uncharacterized protein n=1 Tax=Rhypophila decipiens TaxID=261697 RepID=A0AAN6XVJ9_9PEZI|nr:hypothetical protein QBC37DRAFT_381173 [Rhypophila decipiens]
MIETPPGFLVRELQLWADPLDPKPQLPAKPERRCPQTKRNRAIAPDNGADDGLNEDDIENGAKDSGEDELEDEQEQQQEARDQAKNEAQLVPVTATVTAKEPKVKWIYYSAALQEAFLKAILKGNSALFPLSQHPSGHSMIIHSADSTGRILYNATTQSITVCHLQDDSSTDSDDEVVIIEKAAKPTPPAKTKKGAKPAPQTPSKKAKTSLTWAQARKQIAEFTGKRSGKMGEMEKETVVNGTVALKAEFTLSRTTQAEALLIGYNGKGVFVDCVTGGAGSGACANCHWNGESNQCTFHTPVTSKKSKRKAAANYTVDDDDDDDMIVTPSKKSKQEFRPAAAPQTTSPALSIPIEPHPQFIKYQAEHGVYAGPEPQKTGATAG